MTRPDDPTHPLHPERIARDADELDVDRDLLADARHAAAELAEGPEDPGHLMTADEWEIYGDVRGIAAAMRGVPAGTTVLNWAAKFHGGSQVGTLQINHDAETPLAVGYGRSIGSYFVNGPAAGTSAHHMVDPSTLVHLLPPNVIGYHVGPNGNRGTIGWEQSGYAKFTRAQWMTAAGLDQIEVLAAGMADEAKALGIPDRRLTNAQVAAWSANGRRLEDGGRSSHHAIAVVLGGTSHTDPDPNYPYDVLDARITARRSGTEQWMTEPISAGNLSKIGATMRAEILAALGPAMFTQMYGDTRTDTKTHPYANAGIFRLLAKRTADAAARDAAQLAAIKALADAQGTGIDYVRLQAIVDAAAANAVAGLDLDVVLVKPDPAAVEAVRGLDVDLVEPAF